MTSFANKVHSLSLKNIKKYLSFTLVDDTIVARERTDDGTIPGETLSFERVQVAHATEAKQSDVPQVPVGTPEDELKIEIAKLEERFASRKKETKGQRKK
jgi:hypothetical protein